MAQSHLLVLPAQELAVLQSAAERSPCFAHLLKQLPGFQVAHPLPDTLVEVAGGAREAAYAVRANTNYPEDWDDLLAQAAAQLTARGQVREAQEAALSAYVPLADNPDACPCCGGSRFARSQSTGNGHWFELPHLGFKADRTYTPSKMGIPTGGDGPYIKVCLDCGRVINGEYPLSDDVLQARIEAYRFENCLDENDKEIA